MNKHFFSGVLCFQLVFYFCFFLSPMALTLPKNPFRGSFITYYPQIVAVILSVIGAAIIVKTVGLLQQKELMMQMKCIQMQKCVSVVFFAACHLFSLIGVSCFVLVIVSSRS